jgi:hypothetical protein
VEDGLGPLGNRSMVRIAPVFWIGQIKYRPPIGERAARARSRWVVVWVVDAENRAAMVGRNLIKSGTLDRDWAVLRCPRIHNALDLI